jgi:hypothetical protein
MTPSCDSIPRTQGDYYCDANAVCGVRCAEVDLAEANTHAFHATAHTAADGGGSGGGIGGQYSAGAIRNTLAVWQYGHGRVRGIDTRHPFRVSVSFDAAVHGRLGSIHVSLSQGSGAGARAASFSMARPGYAPLLHDALSSGMTLVLAYWSSYQLDWFQSGATLTQCTLR